MTATFTVTRTDQVLAEMLTENTGRHLLDSGGAYGRNWERNQGRTVEDFLAAPPVTLDARYGYIDVTLDVFHWLRARLEYDADLDADFLAFAEGSTEPWLVDAERFAESTRTERGLDYLNGTYNSYNSENFLSQTIQFVISTDEQGDEYVLLQIHGGCDVRGGYTRPRAFRPSTYDVADLLGWDAYELYCTAEAPQTETLPGTPEPEPHALDYRGEWIAWGGSYSPDPWNGREAVVTPEDGEPYVACPYCGAPMEAGEYPVG